jgi:hypothetical protein
MVLFKAYLDDSGAPHGGHAFMTIAGYVADEAGWTNFERRWADELAWARVPYLHMKEFGNPLSQIYSALKSDKGQEADFMLRLRQVIYETIDFCTQTTIVLSDLVSFNKDTNLDLDAYSLCLYGCLLMLKRRFPFPRVEIIMDKFSSAHSRYEIAVKYAQSDTLEPLLHNPFSAMVLGSDESFKNILPIQAADLIAWEMRKLCEDRKDWDFGNNDRMKKSDGYNRFFEEYAEKHGKPPRERKSFLALREWPSLAPQGLFLIDII